jgi:hypothetical protein
VRICASCWSACCGSPPMPRSSWSSITGTTSIPPPSARLRVPWPAGWTA